MKTDWEEFLEEFRYSLNGTYLGEPTERDVLRLLWERARACGGECEVLVFRCIGQELTDHRLIWPGEIDVA